MTLFQPLDLATIDINTFLSGRLPKEVRAPVSRMSQTSGRGHRLPASEHPGKPDS